MEHRVRAGTGFAYSQQAERELMRWIRETCGREIAEATGGDPTRGALLAALTANESGGRRQAYRFAPENYQRLTGLLDGSEKKVDGLTRAQLEKHLGAARRDTEREEMLKKLAGLHGYTQIAGYLSIVWKEPLEALMEKARHFQLAARRLEQLCQEHELEPGQHATELGRWWSNGHQNGRTRPAMYSWRLRERMGLYLEMTRTQGDGSLKLPTGPADSSREDPGKVVDTDAALH